VRRQSLSTGVDSPAHDSVAHSDGSHNCRPQTRHPPGQLVPAVLPVRADPKYGGHDADDDGIAQQYRLLRVALRGGNALAGLLLGSGKALTGLLLSSGSTLTGLPLDGGSILFGLVFGAVGGASGLCLGATQNVFGLALDAVVLRIGGAGVVRRDGGDVR